jgi:hypothetical protein
MRGTTEVLMVQLAALATTVAFVTFIKFSILPVELVFVPTFMNILAAVFSKRLVIRAIHLTQSGASVLAVSPPAVDLLPHVAFAYRGIAVLNILEVLSVLQGVVWILLALMQAVYIYSLMVKG